MDFTDLSAGNIVGWFWDFGDGGTSEEQNPGHTYRRKGVFDVTLVVTSADSFVSETKVGFVTVSPRPAPRPYAGPVLDGGRRLIE